MALVALVTLVALMGAGMGVGLVWVLAMEVTVGCDFVWRGEGAGDHSISAGSCSGHLGVAAAGHRRVPTVFARITVVPVCGRRKAINEKIA